jgi:hypothetical protein
MAAPLFYFGTVSASNYELLSVGASLGWCDHLNIDVPTTRRSVAIVVPNRSRPFCSQGSG